jgi:hypothetical protein
MPNVSIAVRRTDSGRGYLGRYRLGRRAAEIAHYHRHHLRDRCISRSQGQGVPAKEVAERSGHARAAVSLDHHRVMPLDEVGSMRYQEAQAG